MALHLALDLKPPRVPVYPGRQDAYWLNRTREQQARLRKLIAARLERRGKHLIWTGRSRRMGVAVYGHRHVSLQITPARLVWWYVRHEAPPAAFLVPGCTVKGCVAPAHRRVEASARPTRNIKGNREARARLLGEYENRPRRLNDAEIARRYSVSRENVRQLRTRQAYQGGGTKLSAEQVAEIKHLATSYEGPLRWIDSKARELGVTRETVYRMLKWAREEAL